MEDYKFLGNINGVYNTLKNIKNYKSLINLTDADIREKIINNSRDEFNIFSQILVYVNESQNIFKLIYINELYDYIAYNKKCGYILKLNKIDKGEIILNNIGFIEFNLLLNNFNNNLIKQVLFNKFLDNLTYELNYEYIY